MCGWVNALDLIKCTLSTDYLCGIFHRNDDWLTQFYITLHVNIYLESEWKQKVAKVCL